MGKRETKMKYHFKLLLSAGVLATSLGIQGAHAAKTSMTIALQLEPLIWIQRVPQLVP